MRSWLRKIGPCVLVGAAYAALSTATVRAERLMAETSEPSPAAVAKSYLRAVQARDFNAAYGYLSSADRRVRDKSSYLRNQPSLNGFALRLADWFAARMEFSVIEEVAEKNRVRLELSYRLPSGDEVADRFFEWNSGKLNSLAAAEQSEILGALERLEQGGSLTMIQGRESVSLVREKHGWRIFEDWQSRKRVVFRAAGTNPTKLAVQFLRKDILVKHDEPFQADFKVSNLSEGDMWVTVKHIFAPPSMAKNLEMVACGSLLPFRLKAGETRDISSVYLFRRDFARKDPVMIRYQFLLPTAAETPAR